MKHIGNVGKKTVGRPAKIDIGEALRLRLENRLSYGQIAKLMGVTKQAVEARLSKVLRLLQNHEVIDEFENARGNILSSAELELLYHLLDPEKLRKAGLGDVSKAFAQVANQRRLTLGQSTQNIGMSLKIENIVTMRDKKLQELRERGVPEREIEAVLSRECSLRVAG
jgi:predicted DNA-binding protein YlxM (UPF0122 family)